MSETTEPTVSAKRLRLKIAANSFKFLVLGGKHIVGRPQTESVINAIDALTGSPPFSEGAWRDWCSKGEHIPQPGKMKALDKIASAFIKAGRSGISHLGVFREDFFSELVHGGLMHGLLAPTKSKNVLLTVIGRANEYQPARPLHLHIDAIEVAASVVGFKELPWTDITAVAAQRILEILHERWDPRHGTVYATFTSYLRLQWNAANPQERTSIRERYERLKPDLFDKHMEPGAEPDWGKTGVSSDVAPMHIYKLLFALAADPRFLVEDRLHVWVFDLVTAFLAMHALAWTDRYTTMALRVTEELIYWAAFYQIFFESEPLEADNRDLLAAMALCNAAWEEESVEVFRTAREFYHKALHLYGTSAQEIFEVSMLARKSYPLVYKA